MAFPQVGVQLVARDASKFVSDMRAAQGSLGDFQKASGSAATGTAGLTGGLDGGSASMLKMGAAAGVAFAGVMGVVGAVGAAANGLKNLVNQAMGATAAYEALSMSMSSLVAKEIRATDETLNMEEALDLAEDRTADLLGWIEQLAIKSPFDSRGVALAFKTGLTYGFTSEQAQKLTETLVNFATATGQTSAVVQQLAFPLGQIKNTGKALTQDLRQLTNAGVDVTGVLREMGKGWEDVTAGTVSSDEFIKTFIQTLDRDFGGAAARSANTVAGLKNSVEDLTEIGLRNAFMPAIQATLPLLSAFVDNLQAFLPTLQAIGEGLGVIVTSLVDMFLPAISGTADEAAGNWADMTYEMQEESSRTADEMFDWGAEIVYQFAEGMASAISEVLTVLTQLGSAISYWLAPGSPPRLLPDIDQWGTAAMSEFLGGFEKADFDVFGKLSGMIEKVMRSNAGEDDTGLVPGIMSMKNNMTGLVASLKQGTYSLDVFTAATHGLNVITKQYVGNLVAVQNAQEKLNKINEKYSEILKPINDELSEIAKAREDYAKSQRTEELASIINDENAPALAKEFAMMELREMQLKEQAKAVQDAAQEEGKAAMTELELAQARLEATQLLIDAQLENNKLLKEQAKLMEKLSRAGGGGAGGADGGGKGKSLPTSGGLDLGLALGGGGGLTDFTEKIDELKERIGGLFDFIPNKIDELKSSWEPAISKIMGQMEEWGLSFGDIVKGIGLVKLSLSGLKMGNNILGAVGGFTALKGALLGVLPKLGAVASILGGPVGLALAAAVIAVGTLVTQYGGLEGALQAVADTFTGTGVFGADGIMVLAVQMTAEAVGEWFVSIYNSISETIASVGESIAGFVATWQGNWELIKTTVEIVKDAIVGFIGSGIAGVIAMMGIDIASLRDRWSTIWSDIQLIVATVGLAIIRVVNRILTDIKTWFTEKLTAVSSFVSETFEKIKTDITGKIGLISDFLSGKLSLFKTWFSDTFGEILTTITTTFNSVVSVIGEKLNEAYDSVTEIVGNMLTWMGEQIESWRQMGADLLQGLISGFLGGIGDAINSVTGGAEEIVGAVKGVLGIQSPSRVFMGIGSNIVEGLRMGLAGMGDVIALPQTSMSAVTAGAMTNNYNNFNMGGNNISGGVDLAMMEAMIERVVSRAIQYG